MEYANNRVLLLVALAVIVVSILAEDPLFTDLPAYYSADKFSLEDIDDSPIPNELNDILLRNIVARNTALKCQLVYKELSLSQKHSKGFNFLKIKDGVVVTTKNKCGWQSEEAPIWVFKNTKKATKLLFFSYAQKIETRMPNKSTTFQFYLSSKTNSYFKDELWIFGYDGYIKSQDRKIAYTDTRSCLDNPGICPDTQ